MSSSKIEATITDVVLDPVTGWYRITTDHARAKRLDTKDEKRAKEAMRLKQEGVVATIDITEKQSQNINPHTQQPYMDRYYDHGEASVTSGNGDIPVLEPKARKTDPGDAWRICLAAGGKLAVATLPLMPSDERSFEIQKRIATAWAKFFYFTPVPHEASNEAMHALGFGGSPEPDVETNYQTPPPHSDDDIPF